MRIFVLLIFILSVSTIFGSDIMSDFEGNDESIIDSHLIVTAIDNGVQYLKSQQKPDGQWQYEVPGHTLGATAMCVLSFLDAGVSKEDSSLIRGVQALRRYRAGENIRDTYPVAVQTMALIRYGDPADQSLLEQNVRWFLQQQINDGSDGQGGWQYNSGFRHYSTFETYYVGLALHEAEQNGITVPNNAWEQIRRFWERTQNTDGSWGYRPLSQGSGDAHSCTTNAGIISLILATGIHDSGRFRVEGDHIRCGQWDPYQIFARINHALSSLDKSLVRQLKTGPGWWNINNMNSDRIHGMHWVHYNLFAIEKAGRLLGQRHIGRYDWYREGTISLLRQLREHRTHWADRSGETILATACAVGFLAQGRRPVIISKIESPPSYEGDQHPYDIDHLLRFAGSRWNFPLGWQYLELDKTPIEELVQSPVLYFSGNRTPFTGNDTETKRIAAKLRTYLDQGGFIVAEALQDDKSFDTGFHELMRQVFPEPGYELTLLEPSHPIRSIETQIEPEQRRPLKGITSACRTNVVYIPAVEGKPSLSCLWEVARWNGRNDLYSSDVRRQIESGLEIGFNILTYALDSERKYRDQVTQLKSLRKNTDWRGHRGHVFLGFLSHGEANPAPRALPNLLHWVESNLGLSVTERVDSVDVTDSALSEYPVLFMFGRQAFQFSPEQRNMLRQHLERGGFLFVNSICSSKPFTESLTNEMYQIFPDLQLQPIPPDDPLFSDVFGGFKIDSLELWQPEQSPNRAAIVNLRNEKPELYGICLGDGKRWAVVFSPNDIVCSLEAAGFSGCRGYTPDSAMQLAVNFLLYSLSAY
ncbi:MAG: DUF4159 domain-containing protein [Planctomycetaceae bacterium]|jgi:hypothetical protein|nr:DUF4159 domain-containing protein [Planctomycetaceae bacterium]